MCKKVNFSISNDVDAFLNEMKQQHGISKSKVLTLLVSKYGDKIARDLSKYSKKEEQSQITISSYAE